jgi:ribonuclease HI
MMIPNKHGIMSIVLRETRNHVSFKKKENEMMENYIDAWIINYAILIPEKIIPPENKDENYYQGFWNMSFDGACFKSGSGVGNFFKSPKSIIYPHAIKIEFPCTNNEVEYETLIQGMNLALQMKVENLIVSGDSEMVINHIRKKYKIKKENIKYYAKRVNELVESFNSFNISFIPRDKNQKTDSLVVVASLFNPDDLKSQHTFNVKRIFIQSVPDNQDYLQVFQND